MGGTDHFKDNSRMHIAVWVLLAVLSCVGFVLVVWIDDRPYPIKGNDGIKHTAYVRSLVLDRDLDFKPEWNRYFPSIYIPEPTSIGMTPNKYPAGFSLLTAPFFLAGHLIAKGLSAAGVAVELNGYSAPYGFAVCFGSIAYGLLGVCLCYGWIKRRLSPWAAFLGITSVWLGSSLLYYFFKEPFMSHLVSFFSVSLVIWIWVRGLDGRSLKGYFVLGVCLGVAAMVRQQNAAFILLVVFESLCRWRGWKRLLHTAGTFMAGAVCGFAPQMMVWKTLYGSFLVYSYQNEGFDWTSPKISNVLFSSNHGLLSWSPAVALALAGLILAVNKHRLVAGALLACFAVQLYINASWWNWWFGYAFGGRAFMNCQAIFFFGAAFLFFRIRKGPLAAAFAICVLTNLLLLSIWETDMIPLDRTFSWIEIFGRLHELPARLWDKLP